MNFEIKRYNYKKWGGYGVNRKAEQNSQQKGKKDQCNNVF